MTALTPLVLKKEPPAVAFLSQLGVPHGSHDAFQLLEACRKMHTLNALDEGSADWAIDVRKMLQAFVKDIATKYGLYVIFEERKGHSPAKFAHKKDDIQTLKLIAADVWRWK